MAFTDTEPKLGDSDNNLLFKIAQKVSGGGGGGVGPAGPAGPAGDSLWEENAGVLEPVGANAIRISPWGGIQFSGAAYDMNAERVLNATVDQNAGDIQQSLQLIFNFTGDAGGSGLWASTVQDGVAYQILTASSDGLDEGNLVFGVQLDGGGYAVPSVELSSYNPDTDFGYYSTWKVNAFELNSDDGNLTQLLPTAADGTTPYLFDTSLAHTSGNLLEVKNSGGLRVSVNPEGSLSLGEFTGGAIADSGFGFVQGRDIDSGDPEKFIGYHLVYTASAIDYTAELRVDTSSIFRTWAFGAANQVQEILNGDSWSYVVAAGGSIVFECQPGDPALALLSLSGSLEHTSGNLLEVKNNGTVKHSIDFAGNTVQTGTLTTSDPGGGSGAWSLGQTTAGVALTLVVDSYVEVMIDGVVKKLALVA